MAITLYPSSAWVQIIEDLELQDNKVYFELPPGAQLGSLQVNIDGQFIGHIETNAITSVDSPMIAHLRAQVAKAAQEVARIQGKLAAVKAKISLWSNGAYTNTSVEAIKIFDAVMGVKLEELFVAEATIEPELKQALHRLELLEKSLIEADGQNTYATGVTATLQTENTKQHLKKKIQVQYSYMLSGCGWSPVYRLDALTDKGMVQIVQEAEIRQSSGQDWKDVELTLASVDVGNALIPSPLPGWQIHPASPQGYQPKEMYPVGTNMLLRKASMPLAAHEETTFTTWFLGKMSIPAGIATRFALYKNNWQADFFRLLRPSVQPYAYLVADVYITEPVALLPGSAQFMVDGKVVGNGHFSLYSDKEDIYFGIDSQVRAQMVLDKSQSGRNGFLDKKQSRVWSWNIKVSNDHTTPVKVIVEEPELQSGDTSIIVTTNSTPKPIIEKHMYIWELHILAGGITDIHHSVLMTAPSDMHVIESRGARPSFMEQDSQ